MRRVRLWMVLLLALASGGLAGYLALQYLRQRATPLIAAEPRRNRVAVATRDLDIGALIRAEDVRLLDWPADAVPPGFASSAAEVVGRGVITPIRVNEPLLSTKLADKEAGGGLPIVIPEGMRAVSVRVDEVVQVAGFVTPQTRVDILVTLTRGEGGTITRTVLQNIQVLTAGQVTQRDPEGKPITVSVLTVLVSPEEAEALILAAAEGRIQLALRNTLDLNEITTTGARVATLFGNPQPQQPGAQRPRIVRNPPVSPENRPHRLEIIRGGNRAVITF